MAILRKGIAKGIARDHGGLNYILIIWRGAVLKRVSV